MPDGWIQVWAPDTLVALRDDAQGTDHFLANLQKAVESLTAEPDAEALPARYTLQVSSHPDRDSAERELGRLRGVGVEPHVVVVDVPGKGKLFRIHVGKFHTMDEARTFQGGLREKRGVAGFVTPL